MPGDSACSIRSETTPSISKGWSSWSRSWSATCPRGIKAALRALAVRHHRSVEAEAREILAEAVAGAPASIVDLVSMDEGSEVEFEPDRLRLMAHRSAMRYLLDTNVVSALGLRGGEPRVQAWAAPIPVVDQFVTAFVAHRRDRAWSRRGWAWRRHAPTARRCGRGPQTRMPSAVRRYDPGVTWWCCLKRAVNVDASW